MTRSFIRVRTQFEGLHFYPNAPEEVYFLRHPHRHNFVVSMTIAVSHDDRQLEFFTVKKAADEIIKEQILPKLPGPFSCEQMARTIGDALRNQFKFPALEVVVSEDGENDGVVVYLQT